MLLPLSGFFKNSFAFYSCVGLIHRSISAPTAISRREVVSGILFVSVFEQLKLSRTRKIRGIVTKITASYMKKARGKITAACDVPALPVTSGTHHLPVGPPLHLLVRQPLPPPLPSACLGKLLSNATNVFKIHPCFEVPLPTHLRLGS